jgi:hypothetical protein
MTKPAAVSGHALAESYETLRKDALEGGGHALRGRALLMFKGMAAWMNGMDEAPVPVRLPAADNEMRLPAGIEQNLVAIVATMAFATVLEDRA